MAPATATGMDMGMETDTMIRSIGAIQVHITAVGMAGIILLTMDGLMEGRTITMVQS